MSADISVDCQGTCRPTIGRQSTDYRSIVDRPSVDSRPIVDRYLTDISLAVNRYISADASAVSRSIYRSTIVRLSVDYRSTIDRLSTDYRPTIDRLSTDYRSIVDRYIGRLSADISTEATYSTLDPISLQNFGMMIFGLAMHQVLYLSNLSGFIATFVFLFFMLFSSTSAVLYDKPNCSALFGQLLSLL